MLQGSIEQTFRNNRKRQIATGIILSLICLFFIGAGIVQLMVHEGLLVASFLGAAQDNELDKELIEIGARLIFFITVGMPNSVNLLQGLPNLEIRSDGLVNRTLYGECWAHWTALLPMRVVVIRGLRSGSTRIAEAHIIGDRISPYLKGKTNLVLGIGYDTDIARIVEAANASQKSYFLLHPNEQISLKVSKI